MKVYALIYMFNYEHTSGLRGIYRTFEAARKARDSHDRPNNYDIEEWDVE